jgi:lipoyl(octanoyl) transferase
MLVAPGPEQMARDEALLHAAAESGAATFRFYRWSHTTLSLGYFQPMQDRLVDERIASLPWVRRSSGGAAILHDPIHELTYSFALPSGLRWPHDGGNAICEFHYLIRDVLQEFHVKTRTVLCGEEKKLGNVLCFLHQTPGDLILDGAKVVGSAQRKLRGAFLQHGTILLSQAIPQLPGIRELSGVTMPVTEFTADLTQRFAKALNCEMKADGWTADENELAGRIAREKYFATEWNERR